MKMNWIAATLATATLAVPAFGQIHVYIGPAPPPLRFERRPPPPGEGFIWTEGYWGNRDGRYVWSPGVWQRPPYQGAYWNHPHYDHYQQGWQMHDGHWDHEDHGNHHDDRGDHDDHHDNGHGRH